MLRELRDRPPLVGGERWSAAPASDDEDSTGATPHGQRDRDRHADVGCRRDGRTGPLSVDAAHGQRPQRLLPVVRGTRDEHVVGIDEQASLGHHEPQDVRRVRVRQQRGRDPAAGLLPLLGAGALLEEPRMVHRHRRGGGQRDEERLVVTRERSAVAPTPGAG